MIFSFYILPINGNRLKILIFLQKFRAFSQLFKYHNMKPVLGLRRLNILIQILHTMSPHVTSHRKSAYSYTVNDPPHETDFS